MQTAKQVDFGPVLLHTVRKYGISARATTALMPVLYLCSAGFGRFHTVSMMCLRTGPPVRWCVCGDGLLIRGYMYSTASYPFVLLSFIFDWGEECSRCCSSMLNSASSFRLFPIHSRLLKGDARVRARDPVGHDVRRPAAAGGYPPDRCRRIDPPPDH